MMKKKALHAISEQQLVVQWKNISEKLSNYTMKKCTWKIHENLLMSSVITEEECHVIITKEDFIGY